MTQTEIDAYDRGFRDALQTRSRIAEESKFRVAVAERAVRLLRRALLASGIVTAIFVVITWWLLMSLDLG